MNQVQRSLGALLALVAPIAAQDAETLVAQLGGSDHRQRQAAYRALRSKKDPTTLALLVKHLPKFDYRSQSLGFQLVQSFPRAKSEPACRRLLTGKPSFVRLAAAAWLRQRGDRSTTPHIVACLRGVTDTATRQGMLGRLYNLREPDVLAAIRGFVSPDATAAVLDQALSLLIRAGDTQTAPRVEKVLAAGGPVQRRAIAAAYLVALGHTEHSDALATAIREAKNLARVQQLLQHATRIEKVVQDAILEIAEKQKGHSARQALQLLAKLDCRGAVPTIRRLLESKDLETAKAALQALVTMGETPQPRQLKRILTSGAPAVQLVAADALRRMDDLSGLPVVIALVKGKAQSPRNVRSDAINLLGKFRDPKAVDALLDALMDSDANTRARAFAGVQRILGALFPYRRFDFGKTGYNPRGATGPRSTAAAQIRSWWQQHRAR